MIKEQSSSIIERLKICWYALTKKNYIFFAIGLCIISFIAGVTINSVNANSPSTTNVTNVQSISNIQGYGYETVYINGSKYIVFMSSTGDIEIVR